MPEDVFTFGPVGWRRPAGIDAGTIVPPANDAQPVLRRTHMCDKQQDYEEGTVANHVILQTQEWLAGLVLCQSCFDGR